MDKLRYLNSLIDVVEGHFVVAESAMQARKQVEVEYVDFGEAQPISKALATDPITRAHYYDKVPMNYLVPVDIVFSFYDGRISPEPIQDLVAKAELVVETDVDDGPTKTYYTYSAFKLQNVQISEDENPDLVSQFDPESVQFVIREAKKYFESLTYTKLEAALKVDSERLSEIVSK